MKMVAYHNTGKMAVHIGNKCIMPGATREVDETLIPGFKPPTPPKAETLDPTAELLSILDGSVGEVTAALVDLTAEQLDVLEKAEQDGKTRKGVIEAIAKSRLELAAQGDDDPVTDLDKFAAELESQLGIYLLELKELHKDDDHLLSVIRAEINKRMAKELEGMSYEEIAALVELAGDDVEKTELLNVELERRTAADPVTDSDTTTE